jgi:hypothetical protein
MTKSLLVIGACACVIVVAPVAARAHGIRYGSPTPPTHFTIGNQVVDGSVAGLRAYLDTIKLTEAQLHAQLAPDLESLEERVIAARVVLALGMTVSLAAFGYSILGRSDCQGPSAGDPNFSAKVDAWAACNEANMKRSMVAGLISLGAMGAGTAGWWAITPGRADLMSFANRHNSLSREPLRFQLGYDPTRRLAHGGVAFSF